MRRSGVHVHAHVHAHVRWAGAGTGAGPPPVAHENPPRGIAAGYGGCSTAFDEHTAQAVGALKDVRLPAARGAQNRSWCQNVRHARCLPSARFKTHSECDAQTHGIHVPQKTADFGNQESRGIGVQTPIIGFAVLSTLPHYYNSSRSVVAEPSFVTTIPWHPSRVLPQAQSAGNLGQLGPREEDGGDDAEGCRVRRVAGCAQDNSTRDTHKRSKRNVRRRSARTRGGCAPTVPPSPCPQLRR